MENWKFLMIYGKIYGKTNRKLNKKPKKGGYYGNRMVRKTKKCDFY